MGGADCEKETQVGHIKSHKEDKTPTYSIVDDCLVIAWPVAGRPSHDSLGRTCIKALAAKRRKTSSFGDLPFFLVATGVWAAPPAVLAGGGA